MKKKLYINKNINNIILTILILSNFIFNLKNLNFLKSSTDEL